MRNKTFKVLAVDDVDENLQVVGHILGENEIIVSLASNGERAVKIAQKIKPDLILLDINMPELSGYETCEILKKDEQTKDIPVIFLSALNEKEDVIKGFEYGGVDYITKPFNKAELLSRVFTHLNLKKTKDIIIKQNKILEEQHNNIISSIEYAKIIQKAIFPNKYDLDKIFSENFILNLPKDIVSGDFYWFKQVENTIIIAVADCTGHGVPGAFMSILGIAGLNEIFNNFDSFSNVKASEILNLLRIRIKNALHQSIREITAKDGIDMALCIIDIENKTMQYAGANNSIYIVRLDKDNSTPELLEYKADKMPVSKHHIESLFTNNKIELKQNDTIYMFSDGFADQFGGKKGKKFLKKRFKQLLSDNYHKKLSEQKQILLDVFKDWKGTQEQVDDVLIAGMKIL